MNAYCELKKINFWSKLISMADDSLVKQVYKMRKVESTNRAGRWCWSVKKNLKSLNLLGSWNSKETGQGKAWISIAKISFAHREQRDWKARVDLKPKLRLYKIIKTELKRETYLDLNSRWKWKWLARMRSGTSDLRLETGRWEGIPVEKCICRFCVRDEIESEEHILLSCFLFQRERAVTMKELHRILHGVIPWWVVRDNNHLLLKIMLGGESFSKEGNQKVADVVAGYLYRIAKMMARWTNNQNV